VTCEQAYMTGDGAGKPLGLFTAHADGIPTSRDVSTGNTSTAITYDGLINALYSLKGQYQASKSLRWLFHRDALKQIRKLRDDAGGAGTGQYLWQPSMQLGQPDTLLGIPVISSEYVPSTFTTGLYVGMIADFSHYWIADALSMTIQRLDELYAEANQVGFIGRLETDAMPVLAEAFARVKLA
jgi:HK97 family phage major capsid protein